MSRYPALSEAGRAVPASIFARLREHLARYRGDVIPLQIGDTHLSPPAVLDGVEWAALGTTDLYAYGSPAGWAPLIDAIVDKARAKNRLAIEPAQVQIACGATHALSAAVQGLCDRGDELILMTPHWPLIKGIAISHGVVPVEVPLGGTLGLGSGSSSLRDDKPAIDRPRVPFAADLEAVLERAITPRTAAIYVATPNNPDGAMLSAADRDVFARVAERHQLWLFADEVYEDYGYDAEHVSLATHPAAAARTVTVFSFAKSYAQAGLRIGYALAPEPVAAAMKKLVNHSVYNVPVAMQRAALGAMQAGAPFLAMARERYRAARDRALARLVAPAACPPGGAYLWVDFTKWAGDDCMAALERIAETGVLLAPGSAFGDVCRAHARLCFTGVTEERLDEGIDRINRVLAAW